MDASTLPPEATVKSVADTLKVSAAEIFSDAAKVTDARVGGAKPADARVGGAKPADARVGGAKPADARVGYVFDPAMTRHQMPATAEYDVAGRPGLSRSSHPESPDRLLAIYHELLTRRLVHRMHAVPSRDVTYSELQAVHSSRYIHSLELVFNHDDEPPYSGPTLHRIMQERGYDSVYANEYTLDCARLAAGSTVQVVEAVVCGDLDRGMALVRPPGHHACRGEANGFCYFNNVAVAAAAAIRRGLRVAIVDFDVHHGQATQQYVEAHFKSCRTARPDVCYASIHRYDGGDFFPGTGHVKESACVLNVPIDAPNAGVTRCADPGFGDDAMYDRLFQTRIIPFVRRFEPDLILVSAGFDAGEGDPIGGFHVTPLGFRQLVRQILDVSSRTVLVLEGGYNLETLAASMAECCEELLVHPVTTTTVDDVAPKRAVATTTPHTFTTADGSWDNGIDDDGYDVHDRATVCHRSQVSLARQVSTGHDDAPSWMAVLDGVSM